MDSQMSIVVNNYVQHAYMSSDNMKEKFHVFLNENKDNYFDRNNQNGHITASMFVTNKKKDKVLLTHHKKFDKWLQLGGHNDIFTETPLQTSVREMFEEGFGNKEVSYTLLFDFPLDIDVHQAGEHLHYDICFVCMVEEEDNVILSDESFDLNWFSFTDILVDEKGIYEDRLKRMVKKVKNIV